MDVNFVREALELVLELEKELKVVDSSLEDKAAMVRQALQAALGEL